ncbi:uncharacterized protein C1orf131 homolog isoform X2 [Eublepharis macularius]|uniref:Uncharacterized protein C1orf131 homolog isoform X2 n=1 Tax=Eublepharis macularius TaxID=481883 RepID=A0AA97J3R6_EUBMA|nr:uncharacterized protein C1orf131 homolog isoform X2 [Eublepharis macularius]
MAKSPAGECEVGKAEEDAGVAACLLDAALGSLYDFGESLLDGNKKKRSKKKKSQKLRRKGSNALSEDDCMEPEHSTVTAGKRQSASSFFENLKNELDCDSINLKRSLQELSTPDVVPPNLAQSGRTAEIEIVTFHGHSRKKKPKRGISEDYSSKAMKTIQEKNVDGQGFNLEKARLEVHRFGITGFEKKEQRIMEQERAIMLGAKPPQKEYLNYKVLQEKIKEKKAIKKEESTVENKTDSLKRRKKKGQEARKSKKKVKPSILPTGQVGKFKNGTLILRSYDIKKIKSSKLIK